MMAILNCLPKVCRSMNSINSLFLVQINFIIKL